MLEKALVAERKQEPGYGVGAELRAVASFGGEGSQAGRLVRLSLEHVRLRLAGARPPRPGQAARVVLGVEEQWAAALEAEVMEVGPVEAQGAGAELSMRWVSPSLAAGRRLVSLLEALREEGQLVGPPTRPVWRERVVGRERLARMGEALAARRSRGLARAESGQAVEVVVAEYDRVERRLGLEVVRGGELPGAPFALEAFGYGSVLRMEVERAERGQGRWYVPLGEEVERFRHRWLRRAPAEEGSRVRFRHPLWPQVQVERRLVDVSYEGLSFATEPAEDLVYPGLRVPCVEVELGGQGVVRLAGEVRNVSRTAEGRRCGMAVAPLGKESERLWRRWVEEQLHPGTRTAGGWSEATWRLLERSGYFSLSGKSPGEFERLRAQFVECQARLEAHPELGSRVVRPQPGQAGEVEATLSSVRAYQGTLLMHQLARHAPVRGGSSVRAALREVHLRCYEPAQVDSSVQWLLAYCEAQGRWTQLLTGEFTASYAHTGLACLLPFRLTEGQVEAVAPAPAGYTLGAPTEEERARVWAWLERERPRAWREALDLVPERWSLTPLVERWAQAGLEREREWVVARKEGEALAVAVLERAQPGLNLFNLLDGVRLLPLGDEARVEVQEALQALLAHAAGWYRQRGREVFVHYVESPHQGYAWRAGLRDLGEGRTWVFSAELLPELLEHLCECTVERPRRGSRRGAGQQA